MYIVRREKEKPSFIFFIILGMFSFCFLAVFSYYTSPFSECDNGADAAFFRLVGQGMTKGYLPYRDFFDMKGPWLFFIEYVGQLISYGRLGIFFIQWLNFFVSLIIICKLFDHYNIKNKFLQFGLLLPLALISCVTFEGGNLTEEFSLIPLLSSLYICVLFFENSENNGEFWQKKVYQYAGAFYGFCFGFLLFIRVTNAALICAIIITIVIYLIICKKTVQILVSAGFFIVGLLLAVTPAIIFFAAKGLLRDMLNSVFVLGSRYAEEKTILQHLEETIISEGNNRLFLLIIPLLTPFLLRWRTWRERVLVSVGTLFTFVAIASGNNYTHYYTLTIPLILLAEIAITESFRTKVNRRSIVALGLAILMLLAQSPNLVRRLGSAYLHLFQQSYYRTEQLVTDVSSRIPEEDYQSVFCYNLNPAWYTYADLFPCIKYCGWQNHYISLIPEIYDDLENTFSIHPPTWLVLPKSPGVLPAFLQEKLELEYQLVYQNSSYSLYRCGIEGQN